MGSDSAVVPAIPISSCFNPRSPHGERRRKALVTLAFFGFQSTLPAWGATGSCGTRYAPILMFQSTLPAWGATHSIIFKQLWVHSFNPRSPHGERLPANISPPYIPSGFQSTLPAWGATNANMNLEHITAVSIHAPRMGSDVAGSGTTLRAA